jgi:hypothetical protein
MEKKRSRNFSIWRILIQEGAKHPLAPAARFYDTGCHRHSGSKGSGFKCSIAEPKLLTPAAPQLCVAEFKVYQIMLR